MRTNPTLSPGLLASLAASSGPRVLLLRHSDRYDIPEGDSGALIALTPAGEQRARGLGSVLGETPAWAVSSPLLRCMRTAELLGVPPTPSHHLGDPGPFVTDSKTGARVFGEVGTSNVVYAQIRGETWGCMRPLPEGASLLLAVLHRHLTSNQGTGIAVSHDAIVMPFIAWITGYNFSNDWLRPLDGVVVCKDAVVWRGQHYEIPR